MSGETEQNVSAWTIDSLRYHLEQIAADLDKRYQQRFDAQEHAVTAAFEAQDELLTLLSKLLDERHSTQTKMLDERYATQVKANDTAFIAQSTAMQTAFIAADKAVQAALESAEKAVTKAENASEKRFESVNEFRGQLADQAASFLPRTEADVRISAMSKEIDGLKLQVNGIVSNKAGSKEQLTAIYALAGFIVTLIVIGGFLAAAGVFTK